MKHEVLITQSAERDIQKIWEHIATDQSAAADKFIDELLSQVLKLEDFPKGCPLIAENEDLGVGCYRHLVFKDYRTIFRVSESTVVIVRVIHGAKLLSL